MGLDTSVLVRVVRSPVFLSVPKDARLNRRRIALAALNGSQHETGVTQQARPERLGRRLTHVAKAKVVLLGVLSSKGRKHGLALLYLARIDA